MRPPKLDRILSAESDLQPLLAKAHDLRALSGLVGGFLPPDVARQVRVANIRDGELVLIAATSAVAAKLRLLAPSLCRFLSSQRSQVRSVSLRVQPNASRNEGAATQKVAQFSTPTLDSLRRLYESMQPSPARDALAVLLARRGAIARAEGLRPRTGASAAPARKPRT